MPSFGFVLNDTEISAVIQYVRSLARAPRDLGGREKPPAARAEPGGRRDRKLGRRASLDPLVAAGPYALLEETCVVGPDSGAQGA
jgi:hypothetical protein